MRKTNKDIPIALLKCDRYMLLRIKNLHVVAALGAFDWEKASSRIIILNLEILFDAGKAVTSDSIRDTLDYSAVERKILEFITPRQFNLVEKLAHDLGTHLMNDNRIHELNLEVEKPGALRQAESVSISVFFKK